MDLDKQSTSSYEYPSYESSDECEEKPTSYSEGIDEIFAEEGNYDPNLEGLEDSKLKNWNRWINERKKQHVRIKERLNRGPNSLVMNTEDVYEQQQNRKLIDYASKYKKFDKYRGDPKFWHTPDYLYGDHEDVINCSVQDKFDRTVINKNEPPTMEYVGVPNLVKYEKGLLDGYNDSLKVNTGKGQYFRVRKEQLKHNIELIEKFLPEINDLYIHGTQLPVEETPEQQVTTDEYVDEDIIIVEGVRSEELYDCGPIDYRYPILKIQGTVIDKVTLNEQIGDFEQIIRFQNCYANQIYSSKIIIENIGNICVRYSLEEVEPQCNLDIPLSYTKQLIKRFFFPTIDDVCPPGQINEIPVWFKSRESGLFKESWALLVEPKFSKNKLIKFKFESFVRAESSAEKKLQAVKSYIHKCRTTSVAIKLYDRLQIDSKLDKIIPYNYLFLNKDIFLHNNPDHFYEFEKVQALMVLYEKIPSLFKWDLKINTLRNHILNNVEVLEDKRKYIGELYEISNSLLKPTIDINIDNEKYRCVYQILCSFCNMIDIDSRHLREAYGIVEIDSVEKTSSETIKDEVISQKSSKISKKSNSTTSRRRSAIPHTASLSSDLTLISKSKDSSSLSQSIVSDDSKELFKQLQEQRKSHYVKTLCIKTYQHLLTTVDEITAVIESLNMLK